MDSLADHRLDPGPEGPRNLPLITFNAVNLIPGDDVVPPPGTSISKRILLGDGRLASTRAIGFGDVAPATVLAHAAETSAAV